MVRRESPAQAFDQVMTVSWSHERRMSVNGPTRTTHMTLADPTRREAMYGDMGPRCGDTIHGHSTYVGHVMVTGMKDVSN